MPPMGGQPALKLHESACAVAHTASSSGADRLDPDTAMLRRIETLVDQRVAALKTKGETGALAGPRLRCR